MNGGSGGTLWKGQGAYRKAVGGKRELGCVEERRVPGCEGICMNGCVRR